jgi:hypothetical protein
MFNFLYFRNDELELGSYIQSKMTGKERNLFIRLKKSSNNHVNVFSVKVLIYIFNQKKSVACLTDLSSMKQFHYLQLGGVIDF